MQRRRYQSVRNDGFPGVNISDLSHHLLVSIYAQLRWILCPIPQPYDGGTWLEQRCSKLKPNVVAGDMKLNPHLYHVPVACWRLQSLFLLFPPCSGAVQWPSTVSFFAERNGCAQSSNFANLVDRQNRPIV